MMKLFDFDGLFDEKLAEYMQRNAGKYTEQQWEAVIPKLYKQFGDTYIPKAKATPKAYYAGMGDDELIETLVAHVEQGVPVSDFLSREIEARRPEKLFSLLEQEDPVLLLLAVNFIGSDPRGFEGYFKLLERCTNDEVKEAVCEQLKAGADDAKERTLALYAAGVETEMMLEILSRCRSRDDRVFTILLRAFLESGDDMPMRAGYLAAYGDPRAIPPLLEVIDRDDINFLEYQELKYAVEALGGEYAKPRDFSNDPYFQEISAKTDPPKE